MKNSFAVLRQQHIDIQAGLKRVYDASMGETNTGRQDLCAVRDMLFNHFNFEESELYVALKTYAETDQILKRLLESFDEEKVQLIETMLEFFGAYDGSEVTCFRFARDFGRLQHLVSTRFRREETRLFTYLPRKTVKSR